MLALPLAAAAALLGGLAASPAHAEPHASSGNWQSYLEQPATSNVQAVSATVLWGNVSNARGLTSDGHGNTTLTVTSSNDPATVLLDYGVEVEGTPYIDVEAHSGTSPGVSLASTEAKTYLRTPGSSTLTAAAAAGATTLSVQPGTPQSPLTFAAGDTVTIASPTEMDHIVSASGTTLALKTPLTQAHPAGASVSSTPGAITGDTAFAQQILPWLEGQLAYDATLTDSDGLIVTGLQISTTNGGYDWDFYDGAKTGVVTAFNDLYYQSLRDVAYIEASLGNTAKAAAYNQAADHVRDAINANLLDSFLKSQRDTAWMSLRVMASEVGRNCWPSSASRTRSRC